MFSSRKMRQVAVRPDNFDSFNETGIVVVVKRMMMLKAVNFRRATIASDPVFGKSRPHRKPSLAYFSLASPMSSESIPFPQRTRPPYGETSINACLNAMAFLPKSTRPSTTQSSKRCSLAFRRFSKADFKINARIQLQKQHSRSRFMGVSGVKDIKTSSPGMGDLEVMGFPLSRIVRVWLEGGSSRLRSRRLLMGGWSCRQRTDIAVLYSFVSKCGGVVIRVSNLKNFGVRTPWRCCTGR